MKWFAWLSAVVLLVGCASQTKPPRQGLDTPPPQPTTTLCQDGTGRLTLAGVKLLASAKPVLQKLGDADRVSHSAKYPMETFEYGFGSITICGDGNIIFSLDLKASEGTEPLGELWPGAHFGDSREIVLQQLANLGFCPTNSDGTTVEFLRPEERLTLTFGTDGTLGRAFLTHEGEPTDWRQHLTTPPGFYPLDVRTGTPAIDRVIQAAAAKDSAALGGLVRLSKEACTTQVYGMPGKPICSPGTSDGTLVEVFPYGSCQPNFLYSREQAGQVLTSMFTAPYYVSAVFKLDGEPGRSYSTNYGVVLGKGLEGVGVTLFLDAQGSIVEVVACGSPADMVPQVANFILAPHRAQLG